MSMDTVFLTAVCYIYEVKTLWSDTHGDKNSDNG